MDELTIHHVYISDDKKKNGIILILSILIFTKHPPGAPVSPSSSSHSVSLVLYCSENSLSSSLKDVKKKEIMQEIKLRSSSSNQKRIKNSHYTIVA